MNERYEEFIDVIHVYDGVNGECAFVNDGETYAILTGDGKRFETVRHIQGSMYAALRALYGDIPVVDDREVLPTKIAIAGKPAMATYQFMAHYEYYTNLGPRYGDGKREIAELIGVSYETVQKYFRRVSKDALEIKIGGFRDRHYWR